MPATTTGERTFGRATAAALNGSGISGSVADAETEYTYASAPGTDLLGEGQSYTLAVNGVEVFSASQADDGDAGTTLTTTVSINDVVAGINQKSNETGVSAAVNDDGDLVMTAADGRNIELQETGTQHGLAAADGTVTTRGTTTSRPPTSPSPSAELVLPCRSRRPEPAVDATKGVNVDDISTREGANEALTRLDAAISAIDSSRSDLGAVQNRFESTIANLQNISENISAARSRILDADIAQETSKMTSQNILQQAGVSILAQANQAPQLALSLLG